MTGGGSLGSARREGRLGVSRSIPASPRSAKKLSIESNNSRSRIRSQNAAMDKSNCSVLQRKGASNSSISRHSRKGGNPKSLSNAESSDFSAWATESRMDFSQESEYVTGLPILLRGMADKHEEINRRVNALGAKMGFLEKASHRTPRALPGEPSPSTKQQVNNSRTNNAKKGGNKQHGLMPNKKNSPLAPMTPIVVKQPDSATAPDVEEGKVKGDEEGEEPAPLAATLRRQFDRMLDEQQFDPEEASRELLALAGALGDEEAERRASLAAAARRRSAAAAASSAAAAGAGGSGGSMSVGGGASAGGVLLCVDGIDLSDGVLDESDLQSISSKLQLQPKGLQDISRASRLNGAALPAISGSNTPTKRPPPQKPDPLDISDLTVS